VFRKLGQVVAHLPWPGCPAATCAIGGAAEPPGSLCGSSHWRRKQHPLTDDRPRGSRPSFWAGAAPRSDRCRNGRDGHALSKPTTGSSKGSARRMVVTSDARSIMRRLARFARRLFVELGATEDCVWRCLDGSGGKLRRCQSTWNLPRRSIATGPFLRSAPTIVQAGNCCRNPPIKTEERSVIMSRFRDSPARHVTHFSEPERASRARPGQGRACSAVLDASCRTSALRLLTGR